MELELRSVERQGAHEVGGRAQGGGSCPHPREQGVGPLALIFGKDFLLFILRYSMEFQVIPRIYFFLHIKQHHGNSAENSVSPG